MVPPIKREEVKIIFVFIIHTSGRGNSENVATIKAAVAQRRKITIFGFHSVYERSGISITHLIAFYFPLSLEF